MRKSWIIILIVLMTVFLLIFMWGALFRAVYLFQEENLVAFLLAFLVSIFPIYVVILLILEFRFAININKLHNNQDESIFPEPSLYQSDHSSQTAYLIWFKEVVSALKNDNNNWRLWLKLADVYLACKEPKMSRLCMRVAVYCYKNKSRKAQRIKKRMGNYPLPGKI